MRALIYLDSGAVELQERPDPVPAAPDDVLVRVTGSGICGTDRGILLGRFPARPGVIMGHESVGVVAGRGRDVRSLSEGDRVVVDPTLWCGGCDRCRRGATNFCRNKRGSEVGVDRDGTFADYVVLPERFVHRLPDGLDVTAAVLIEPLACVLNNLRAAALTVDDVVVVLGGGPIGLLAAVVGARTARRVVVVEPDPFRSALARTRVDHVVSDPGEPDGPDALLAAVLDATDGERPNVVVETTGTGLERALGLIDDGGRVVLMGFDGGFRATLAPLHLTNHGISLIGAGDYRGETFPVAVALAPELDLAGVVTHQYPLEDYATAFGALGCAPAAGPGTGARRGVPAYGAMKVVLRSEAGEGADGWPSAVSSR